MARVVAITDIDVARTDGNASESARGVPITDTVAAKTESNAPETTSGVPITDTGTWERDRNVIESSRGVAISNGIVVQLGVGRSSRSVTRTSGGAFDGSSFSPSCS